MVTYILIGLATDEIRLQVLLEGKGGLYTSTLKQYQAKANYFACACVQKNDGYNVHLTPGKCYEFYVST